MDSEAAERVLAVLVVHDGAAWLPATLDSLDEQHVEGLEVVAVDNGSTDGSRDLLIERLGTERVLVADRDLGFGAAVAMALDASVGRDAASVLLLHDDMALEPGCVATLVKHLQADPRLGIVGPKKRRWEDPTRLQAVGMTVDVTGRPDSDIEPDELDHGQHDHVQRVLYVSTAGMLVRREVFTALGGFDRRYHLFRDDLDLCWRAWLAGYDVEVVPAAAVRHVAGAANYRRMGQTAFLGPRYFAERNTLATLLKNYGTARLLVVLPLFLVVGVAKILGFLATRRLTDASQTLRAWAWNVAHLPSTLRLRRRVQSTRTRTDGELSELFTRVVPRLRAYAEAIGDWVAGGDEVFDEAAQAAVARPRGRLGRGLTYVQTHPVSTLGLALFLIGIVVAVPVLRPGALRGGEFAPWPSSATAFFRPYTSAWHEAGAIGTPLPPSPAQAVLGIVSLLTAGSSWLASRLLLLGTIPLAWLLSLRAASVVTEQRLPRLAAATAFVLSPPVLASLTTGRVSDLGVVISLPALVASGALMIRPEVRSDRAWRATAATALAAALAIAFEPAAAIGLAAVGVVALVLVGANGGSPDRVRGARVRLLTAGAGTLLLLVPWSLDLFGDRGPIFHAMTQTGANAQPFWRWLFLTPDLAGFPGVIAGSGFVLAAVIGLLFGFRRRPGTSLGLWALALAGTYAAWGLGRMGASAWAWPGLPLLVSAAAFAGLLALGFASARSHLVAHAFGWRHVTTLVTTAAVLVSLSAAGWGVLRSHWRAYSVGQPLLPAFVGANVARVGPFRVLVLADEGGVVHWDLTGPDGPTMATYGLTLPPALNVLVDRGISDLMGGADPGAASRFGLANIRYVVVPEAARSPALDDALGAQLDLEPQPVASGAVYRVSSWMPRASVVPQRTAEIIAERGEVPPGVDAVALGRDGPGPASYRSEVDGAVAALVANVADEGWEARADGRLLRPTPLLGLVRFDVPADASVVTVTYARQGRWATLVTFQLLVVLAAISLVLRPPRFAEPEPRP